MYYFECNDIMFAVRHLKDPQDHFDLSQHVTFSSAFTRSSTKLKLTHMKSTNNLNRHYYFNRLPCLWNSLPPFDINKSISTIKQPLTNYLYDHFLKNCDTKHTCSYHIMCPCAKCSHLPLKHFLTFFFNCMSWLPSRCPSIPSSFQSLSRFVRQ